MATSIVEALRGINAYPIPQRVFDRIAVERGLNLNAELAVDGVLSKGYRLAKADVLMWLSSAPSVSQGGQSYSFSEDQRKDMRNEARKIYDTIGADDDAVGVVYGYKGDRL